MSGVKRGNVEWMIDPTEGAFLNACTSDPGDVEARRRYLAWSSELTRGWRGRPDWRAIWARAIFGDRADD